MLDNNEEILEGTLPTTMPPGMIQTDAFLNAVTTSSVDGTTTLKIEIYPDIDTEKALFALKKQAIHLTVFPLGNEGKPW